MAFAALVWEFLQHYANIIHIQMLQWADFPVLLWDSCQVWTLLLLPRVTYFYPVLAKNVGGNQLICFPSSSRMISFSHQTLKISVILPSSNSEAFVILLFFCPPICWFFIFLFNTSFVTKFAHLFALWPFSHYHLLFKLCSVKFYISFKIASMLNLFSLTLQTFNVHPILWPPFSLSLILLVPFSHLCIKMSCFACIKKSSLILLNTIKPSEVCYIWGWFVILRIFLYSCIATHLLSNLHCHTLMTFSVSNGT